MESQLTLRSQDPMTLNVFAQILKSRELSDLHLSNECLECELQLGWRFLMNEVIEDGESVDGSEDEYVLKQWTSKLILACVWIKVVEANENSSNRSADSDPEKMSDIRLRVRDILATMFSKLPEGSAGQEARICMMMLDSGEVLRKFSAIELLVPTSGETLGNLRQELKRVASVRVMRSDIRASWAKAVIDSGPADNILDWHEGIKEKFQINLARVLKKHMADRYSYCDGFAEWGRSQALSWFTLSGQLQTRLDQIYDHASFRDQEKLFQKVTNLMNVLIKQGPGDIQHILIENQN